MTESMTKAQIAKTIDHTLLAADATEAQVKKLCTEAKNYGFFSVCVNPSFVPLAVKELKGTGVKVCSVVGFPLGALPTELKIQETEWLLSKGVDEIDMVMNIGAFKDNQFSLVENEFKAIKSLMSHKILKVIIETSTLDPEEIEEATELVLQSGADFVKTSTGFGSRGANEEDLRIMLEAVQESPVKVKASGGIKTKDQLKKYLEMGVARIGTSSGVALLEGLEGEGY